MNLFYYTLLFCQKSTHEKFPFFVSQKPLDSFYFLLYDKNVLSTDNLLSVTIQAFRACTGFDGDFEVVEAIRGLGPR